MKKQEIYTPLFETKDPDIKKVTCQHCGKAVKETLINQDGICIECIMNNKINSDNGYSLPNEMLFASFLQQYKQYLKSKPKSPAAGALVGAAGAAFGLLGAVAMSVATNASQSPGTNPRFDLINKKIKPSSFEKCNKMIITIRDESWICPCCNNDNFGAHFCKICGVYPKFKLED